jgi:general secretion pathway protein C
MVKSRSIHGLTILTLAVCLGMQVFFGTRTAAAQGEPPIEPELLETDKKGPALFPGVARVEEEAQAGGPRAHPVAAHRLDFMLVGTVVVDAPGKSLAVMENESTGGQRGYLVGDQVGEITIKKILHGKVVIQTPSGDAVLSVKSGGGPEPFIAPPDATPPRIARLDRQEFDAVLPDYTHLMREIRMRPRFSAGRPKGFVIYNIAPESLLDRMGLKNGDLIMGVNDTSFATTQPVVEFYETLKAGGPASFKVERDGDIKQLHIEFTD